MRKTELPIEEIVKKWEIGVELERLVEEYGVAATTIRDKIEKYYNSCPAKRNRVLRGITIVIDYLKKGLTPEQIIETAKKSKIIIPNSVMQEAIKKVHGTIEERVTEDTGKDIDD